MTLDSSRMLSRIKERRFSVDGPNNFVPLHSTTRCREDTELRIVTTSRGNYLVVKATGTLNGQTAPQLRDVIYGLLAEPNVAIDILGITCRDVSGLAVFVNTLRRVDGSGEWPGLVGIQASLLRLFQAVGLTPNILYLDCV